MPASSKKFPLSRESTPPQEYLLKLLLAILRKSGGEIRLKREEMEDLDNASLLKMVDERKKEIILRYGADAELFFTIPSSSPSTGDPKWPTQPSQNNLNPSFPTFPIETPLPPAARRTVLPERTIGEIAGMTPPPQRQRFTPPPAGPPSSHSVPQPPPPTPEEEEEEEAPEQIYSGTSFHNPECIPRQY